MGLLRGTCIHQSIKILPCNRMLAKVVRCIRQTGHKEASVLQAKGGKAVAKVVHCTSGRRDKGCLTSPSLSGRDT